MYVRMPTGLQTNTRANTHSRKIYYGAEMWKCYSSHWFNLLWICCGCCTACCIRNPQLIAPMEFDSFPAD